jgi:hypothetical protein
MQGVAADPKLTGCVDVADVAIVNRGRRPEVVMPCLPWLLEVRLEELGALLCAVAPGGVYWRKARIRPP